MSSLQQSEAVNPNILPELEDGVYLDDLPEGIALEVETAYHKYTIVNYANGGALISGHPRFCPEPIPVTIEGSTWGGSMLKIGFIGIGMHLIFQHPTLRTITTSPVINIRLTNRLLDA